MEMQDFRHDIFELRQQLRLARQMAVSPGVLARVSQRLASGGYLTSAAARKTAQAILLAGDGWLVFG